MSHLYDVPAPAKLNLFLHIIGRRPDGYHELQTAFRFIDLYDRLDFERTNDGQITRLTGSGAQPSATQDLVVRAARALQRSSGTSFGVRICNRKTIPMGAGLGGGSSNAASTLIALNRLWRTGFKRAELLRLALPLGADVPVFVFGQSAFAQGVGEDLQAINLPARSYCLLQPLVHVSTAEIFSAPDLTRDSKSVKITDFADWQTSQSGFFGRNDLQAVLFKQHPQLGRFYEALRVAGWHFRVTGSGSSMFAQFADTSAAQVQLKQIISKIKPDQVAYNSWVCQGLDEHPLRGWLVN